MFYWLRIINSADRANARNAFYIFMQTIIMANSHGHSSMCIYGAPLLIKCVRLSLDGGGGGAGGGCTAQQPRKWTDGWMDGYRVPMLSYNYSFISAYKVA